MKKLLPFAMIAVLVVAGFFGWRFFQQQQNAAASDRFQTVPAGRGNLIATIGGTGTVRANQSAIITWQTTGIVEQVYYGNGDLVTTDQELAVLQRTSLPQSVILAQADLESALKALDDLSTSAEIARTNALRDIAKFAQAVRDAQYQLDNYTIPTNQSGLNAIDALDKMKEKLDQARAEFEPLKYLPVYDTRRQEKKDALDTAQSDYNAAVRRLEYDYNLEVAQANLEKARNDYNDWKDGPNSSEVAALNSRIDAAQATINLARLAAPFTATITRVDIHPGDQVSPGNPAFRLDDFSHLLVDVQISEVDINRISLNQPANLTFDAIANQEYHGVVIDVARVGTITQGLVDFIVTVELTDADELVKPGMTTAVNIVVDQLEDVLLAPNRAVRLLEGKRAVYILVNDTPQPLNITLGSSSETHSEVIAGDLKVGDLIVLNPPTAFEQNGPPPWVQR